MPMIRIEALPQQKSQTEIFAVIQRVSELVAKEMSIPAHAVRCIWHEVDPMFYAQGGHTGVQYLQPSTSHGPLVTLALFAGRDTLFIEKLLHLIAETLVCALAIDPKNICVMCQEYQFHQVLDHGQIFTPFRSQ